VGLSLLSVLLSMLSMLLYIIMTYGLLVQVGMCLEQQQQQQQQGCAVGRSG
jgi:hypothetical protein